MLISDWSSDVCSSDLQRPPQPALRLQPLRVAGGGLVMGHGLVDCVCRNRKLAGEHRQEALAARSEEHTSELQSLMRISYAVFCLKKKNIKESYHCKYEQDTRTHTQ